MKPLRLFPIILVVLFAFFEEVSSESRHLSGHDDLFEDAILEHLRDIRDEEEENEPYYSDPDDEVESQDEQEESLTKNQLMQVLDVIKKEAHKRQLERLQSEKELTTETQDDKNDKNLNIDSKDKKDSTSSSPSKKDSEIKKDELALNVNKRADSVNTNAEPVKVKRQENDQVASVEFDNSIEKENELINNIDLRDVLGAKDEGDESTNTNPPKPAHIKQENVVTTKQNKDGLDHVSFIAVVAGCCVAAIAGLGLAAYCWYKLRVETKEDVEDPKTIKKSSLKKSKDPKEEQPLSKDEEMNRNAEYYNYQHAKNQIKQLGQPIGSDKFGTIGGAETTDDEDDDDDNTVYECPGPGASGDMKIVNPMFSDGESRHSDKTSHDGSPTPPNERVEAVTNNNNNQ